MVIILNAVGVPIEGLSLILPVDRILDSFRSPVNLWSNSLCTVIVAKLEGEKLKPQQLLDYKVQSKPVSESDTIHKELERERHILSRHR